MNIAALYIVININTILAASSKYIGFTLIYLVILQTRISK